jgi:ABC-type nitrate/sulfonate/bicarbonate transport system permease component
MSASLAAIATRRPERLGLARLKRLAAGSAGIGAILLAWFVIGQWELVNAFLVPPIGAVAQRLLDDVTSGDLVTNAAATLERTVAGFAIACAIGVPVGIAVASRRLMRWFCEPLISIGFPMPKIAFLPIFILWFGVYDLSKIVMVAFACIFAIVASADAGMRGVDKFLIWSARSMGTSGFALFRDVLVPAAMPQIFTGLQIALPTALITTVVAEMLMGGAGLGGAMLQSGRFADSVGVYAGIVETAAVGMIAVGAMSQLRRRLLRWHPEFARR